MTIQLRPLPGKTYVWQGRWTPTGLACATCDSPDGYRQPCGELVCSECRSDHLSFCGDCHDAQQEDRRWQRADYRHDARRLA